MRRELERGFLFVPNGNDGGGPVGARRSEYNFGETSRQPEYIQYNREWVARTLDVPQNGRVLDFACGTGLITSLAQDRLSGTGTQIIGVDPNAASIEIARRTVLPSGKIDIQFVEGDAGVLFGMPEATIDAAYIGNAIHEIPGDNERLRVLQGIYHTLRDGGKVHFNSAYTSEWYAGDNQWAFWKIRAMRKLGRKRDRQAPEFVVHKAEKYAQIAEQAGFRVDRSGILIVPVGLSATFLRAISTYDTFAEGVFIDMEGTAQVSLAEKSGALIETLDDMENELRVKTGDPNTQLIMKRNWVEVTGEKSLPPLPPL